MRFRLLIFDPFVVLVTAAVREQGAVEALTLPHNGGTRSQSNTQSNPTSSQIPSQISSLIALPSHLTSVTSHYPLLYNSQSNHPLVFAYTHLISCHTHYFLPHTTSFLTTQRNVGAWEVACNLHTPSIVTPALVLERAQSFIRTKGK